MKTLLHLIKWDIILLNRNRLFVIAGVIAAMYIGIFYLLKPLGSLDKILTVLIVNDPVVTGYIFAGILLMFDKGQNTLQALSVTPVKLNTYLLSKTIVLSLLGMVSSIAMAAGAVGSEVNYIHLAISSFFATFIFAALGFAIGAVAKNFNSFLIYSMPIFILSGIPFFWVFGIGSLWWYFLLPISGGVGVLYGSVATVEPMLLFASYLQMAVFCALCWAIAKRVTSKKL